MMMSLNVVAYLRVREGLLSIQGNLLPVCLLFVPVHVVLLLDHNDLVMNLPVIMEVDDLLKMTFEVSLCRVDARSVMRPIAR